MKTIKKILKKSLKALALIPIGIYKLFALIVIYAIIAIASLALKISRIGSKPDQKKTDDQPSKDQSKEDK